MLLWIPSFNTYLSNVAINFCFFSYDNIMNCAAKRDSVILRLVVGKREKNLAYKTEYVRFFSFSNEGYLYFIHCYLFHQRQAESHT